MHWSVSVKDNGKFKQVIFKVRTTAQAIAVARALGALGALTLIGGL